MQNNSKVTNIKPLLTMAIGFWFFLVHIADAARFTRDYGYSRMYPGVGIMLIIAGYFLCGLAGFIEWRRPSTIVRDTPPQKEIEREIQAPIAPQSTAEKVAPVTPKEPPKEHIVKEEPAKPKPLYPSPSTSSRSYVEEYRIQSKSHQPISKEQKILFNWAKRLDRHKDIYEKCLKCDKYGFIEVADTGSSLVFTCPNCNERFTLKK
jgi:hypothetical protein